MAENINFIKIFIPKGIKFSFVHKCFMLIVDFAKSMQYKAKPSISPLRIPGYTAVISKG